MNYLLDNHIEKMICKYGEEAQIIKTIEELSELSHILAKSLNHPSFKELTREVFEEIIDVKIMIQQLEFIFQKDFNRNARIYEEVLEKKVNNFLGHIYGTSR